MQSLKWGRGHDGARLHYFLTVLKEQMKISTKSKRESMAKLCEGCFEFTFELFWYMGNVVKFATLKGIMLTRTYNFWQKEKKNLGNLLQVTDLPGSHLFHLLLFN